jgi:hypothetical protein
VFTIQAIQIHFPSALQEEQVKQFDKQPRQIKVSVSGHRPAGQEDLQSWVTYWWK